MWIRIRVDHDRDVTRSSGSVVLDRMDPVDRRARRPRSAASSERRADDVLDGRWVVVLEVLLGGRRQRQDLKPAAVEGDEVLVDQTVADQQVLVVGDLERVADPVVGVVADAVAVAGEDEEEVERALGVAERREEALVQEVVGDESEATGDAADPVGPRWRAMRWSSASGG